VFTQPIASATTTETIDWLNQHNITIYCTYLQASVPYHTVSYNQPSAIVMGTEATGISDAWIKAAHQNIIIPMAGKIDSMNVSTATAVVVFEAKRQRNFKN
jgi:TrmH family RNA methyltransferase